MSNLLKDEIFKTLKSSDLFRDKEGEVLRDKVIDYAIKNNDELLNLLINNKKIEETFFLTKNKFKFFKSDLFIDYIKDKDFLENSYTKFKNKIGLAKNNNFLSDEDNIILNWPFKDTVLVGGQSTDEIYQNKKEIFLNEVIAYDDIDKLYDEKVLTNGKIYSKNQNKNIDLIEKPIDKNFVIKGNNLIALSCLEKTYQEKIKLIYCDPPYNTGGSSDIFSYNNNFKHSTWLTFMKNRLEISKRLLRKDGFIAITIDHVELFYLGALADEIFGQENRVGIITIFINPKGRQHERYFSASTEYMLVYAKDVKEAEFQSVTIDEKKQQDFNFKDNDGKFRWDNFARIRTSTKRSNKPNFWYPIYVSKDLNTISLKKQNNFHEVYPVSNGQEFTWKVIKETFEKKLSDGNYKAFNEKGTITIKNKFRESEVLKDLWTDKKYFSEFQGTNLLKKEIGEKLAKKFSYPKSLYSVLDTLKIMTSKNDIILDFFAGSGTTGRATQELNRLDGGNRKFILVEQVEDHIEIITKRLSEYLDKDNFIYFELKKLNQNFTDKINNAKTTQELFKIYNEIKKHGIMQWSFEIDEFENKKETFQKLKLEDQKNLMKDILNKNQLYVNFSEIDDKRYDCSKSEKELTKSFYGTQD
tara:strand:+ start:185 stop:2104 length:1920 start_codon:yes stop_codon:yes gene_type:complete